MDLASQLLLKGFVVETVQEEDESLLLDAEIQIAPDIVVQIDWSGRRPEYGVTVEPRRVKREYSDFHHVGYVETLDSLFTMLERVVSARAVT